jgi:hypothetical protein
MSDLYRQMLRWAALPVTSRRWAAPLSALALGFGLFVGVALSPDTSGSLATGAPQIVEMPAPAEAGQEEGGGGEGLEAGGAETASAAPETEEAFSPAPATFPFAATAATGNAPPPSSEGTTPDHAGTQAPKEEEETPPESQSADLAGTVVHVNPAAGSYTVVEEGGLMTAVHAASPPAPGARIEVPIRTLANGTLAEAGKRTGKGTVEQTTLSGIVTFADASTTDPAYAISNRGVSLLVHVRPDPAGAAPQLPALGAYASVAVEIEAPPASASAPVPDPAPAAPASTCQPDPAQAAGPAIAPAAVLWQRTIQSGGAPFTSSAFEGIVAGVCPDSGQVLISADDTRESGTDLLFTLPPAIKATKTKIGESVLVNAAFAADGTLSLTGMASDELTKGADDRALTQGDLVAAKGGK